VVSALTGWLGLVLVVLAVLTTLALEVRDERLPGDEGSRGAAVTRSRSRAAGRVLHLVLLLLIVAFLAATAVRMATLAA
jgi:hypothetical protein